MSETETLETHLQELRRGTAVLACLRLLKLPGYGYGLLEELSERGFETDANTLYPLLRRLEKQGHLTSEWNTDEARPRKFYRTSAAGRGSPPPSPPTSARSPRRSTRFPRRTDMTAPRPPHRPLRRRRDAHGAREAARRPRRRASGVDRRSGRRARRERRGPAWRRRARGPHRARRPRQARRRLHRPAAPRASDPSTTSTGGGCSSCCSAIVLPGSRVRCRTRPDPRRRGHRHDHRDCGHHPDLRGRAPLLLDDSGVRDRRAQRRRRRQGPDHGVDGRPASGADLAGRGLRRHGRFTRLPRRWPPARSSGT